jgi:SAM-dependent methyltransferase
MTTDLPTLLARAVAVRDDPRWRAAVLRHVQGIDALDSARLRLDIHPGDQMLLHSLAHHRDAGAALSQYAAVSLQQYAAARQVLALCAGADGAPPALLDFACGYGRLLRWLSLAQSPRTIWAADIQSEAVAFVAHTFGVHGLPSDADPVRFVPPRPFDGIWVASLFSHLPEPLFRAWLQRLLALLTPSGVLCFSVRDASLLPAGVALPERGIFYATRSENADLDPAIYGTAYASEDFVRAALRDAAGDLPCVRLPRALAQEQDLYVVARDPGRSLSALDGFRRGPWGWVDRRDLDAQGNLRLQGWAASFDDGAIARLDITVDGEHHACATGQARGDVGDAFGDRRFADSGFDFRLPLRQGVREVWLEVSACTARDERALLFAGPVTADHAVE